MIIKESFSCKGDSDFGTSEIRLARNLPPAGVEKWRKGRWRVIRNSLKARNSVALFFVTL
jgi:hypothetical protein